MKEKYWYLVAIAVLLLAVVCAGCSSSKSGDAGKTSSADAGTSSSAAVTTVAAPANSCPPVTAATSWTGKWASWSNNDECFDGRQYFYPPTEDNPEPWAGQYAGQEEFPVTFTQSGCDVTGSITVGQNGTEVAPYGCPISLTGKVDSTGAVSGTWKAYCDIAFYGTEKSLDSGTFSLNMEPGGSTFIGTFGTSDTDVTTYKTTSCPSANSNWAGKRA